MKTFSLSSKIFYKNTVFLIIYIFFISLTNANFIRIFQGVFTYNQPAFVFLSETLMTSIFCTIFFLFLSYEFFIKTKSSHMDECIAVTPRGQIKLLLSEMFLIIILILTITVTTVIYNFIYPNTELHNSKYILHMLCSIFVYLFLVPLTGACIGACASLVFKRLSAYLFMITFVLLGSPLMSTIAYAVSEATMTKVNITPLFDLFNIFPLNLDYSPIYNFGISLLPYKLEAIFFWLFAAVCLTLFKILKPARFATKIITLCCTVLCVLNLVFFFLPSSKVDMSFRVDGTLMSDHDYYSELYKSGYPDEQKAEFQVLSYDLDITVKNQLKAEAILKIDKDDLPVYRFTLYHNYKIKKITDQNNQTLKFKHNNDHVEVYSSDKSLSEIHFTYSGYNTRFYSNIQGIFLPGYFAYYPISGFRNVYSSDKQHYSELLLSEDVDFHLTVNSNQEIFTNLEKNDNDSYSGRTNGLTIMSGFLKSTTVKGIEIIYPYFNTEEYNENQLKKDIENFIEVKKDDVVKKIFVVPNVNQKSDSVVAYSDYITTTQVMALPDQYINTKMLKFKSKIYLYQKIYLEDRESFNNFLKSEENYPPEIDKICTLYQENINLFGEEIVIEKTNQYIFNNNDTRSVADFLKQLKQSS